jgi:hypothetical protein
MSPHFTTPRTVQSEEALKVSEKPTIEAKDGVLTEVKITGMGKVKGKGKANG